MFYQTERGNGAQEYKRDMLWLSCVCADCTVPTTYPEHMLLDERGCGSSEGEGSSEVMVGL